MSKSDETASRLYQRVVSLIIAQRLGSGERLGTERDLADRFGVSRGALRSALELLESEGRIRRVIGRSGGIFVSDGKIERELNRIAGVPTFLRQQGFTSATKIIHTRLAVSGADDARVLGVPFGSPICEITRVRFANDVSLSLETALVPARLFPHLLEKDLSGSLYTILTREYGCALARADEYIDARAATEDEASALGIDVGAVVFDVRRITSDAGGVVVEWAHDIFRADRTRFAAHAGGTAPIARVADPIRRAPRPGRPSSS